MAKQIIDLYGEQFTMMNPTHVYPLVHKDRSLYDCYAKPSQRKIVIWEYWLDWMKRVDRDNNYVKMWVCSYNCNFFTIKGVIDTPCDEHYVFYITSTRQEIWQVID